MELKSCHCSLTLNVNINDLNVFRRVVKQCSGLFKIIFTQTRGEIIRLIPYLHIKWQKCQYFYTCCALISLATSICFKSTPKMMLQRMHYQFYVVFLGYWCLMLSYPCNKASQWLDITILCSLKNYLSCYKTVV